MLRQQDIRPGPSSQTTFIWSQLVPVEEQTAIESISFHASNFIIQASRERVWDEMMEEVLQERSQAWERLADL
jgi:hypothetical protein